MALSREDIRTLFAYNDWANDRLLGMLAAAFGEETDLRVPGGPRTIQEIAAHILSAQFVWRERWEGRSPTAMLDPANYPTVATLRRAFEEEREKFWRYFATLDTDEGLERIVNARTTRGEPCIYPLAEMMQHSANHGTYHRGQITALLMNLGHEAAVDLTDMIVFYGQQRNG